MAGIAPGARQLRDSYRFKGFPPSTFVLQHPEDPAGWVIDLSRRGKGGSAEPAVLLGGATTSVPFSSGTSIVAAGTSTSGSL